MLASPAGEAGQMLCQLVDHLRWYLSVLGQVAQ
jgi:hypothetical protein